MLRPNGSFNPFLLFLSLGFYCTLSKHFYVTLDSHSFPNQGLSSATSSAATPTLSTGKSAVWGFQLSSFASSPFVPGLAQFLSSFPRGLRQSWKTFTGYLALPIIIEPHCSDIVKQGYLQAQVLSLQKHIRSLQLELLEQQHKYKTLEELYCTSHASRRRLKIELEELRMKCI